MLVKMKKKNRSWDDFESRDRKRSKKSRELSQIKKEHNQYENELWFEMMKEPKFERRHR